MSDNVNENAQQPTANVTQHSKPIVGLATKDNEVTITCAQTNTTGTQIGDCYIQLLDG